MKLITLFILLLLPLTSTKAQEADVLIQDMTRLKSGNYLRRQQTIVDLTRQIKVQLRALKEEAPKTEKRIDLAIQEIEKGLSTLNAIRREGNQKKQLLVETVFIEIGNGKAMSAAKLNQNLRWENGQGVPTLATEENVESLKALGVGVSAPSVLVLDGGEAIIETEDLKKFFYLERRNENLYEMKTTEVKDGLAFKMKAKIQPSKNSTFISVESALKTTSVIGRTPCQEGAETIGLPVMSSRKSEMSLTIVPDKWFVVPAAKLDTGAKSILVCAIKVTILD
ncbi:MAG: hypothetical protein ACI97A_003676 [Planctomycetota bacterium]|jgi:hypothetical protein